GPARGARALGGQRRRSQRVRQGGAGSLPQLRPVRAEGVRPGRYRLRAPADVRTGLIAVGVSAGLERARWGPWEETVTMLPRSYAAAVQRAGALALLLPPDDGVLDAPEPLLDRIDGVILAGGSDLDPASYGAAPDPATGQTW